MDSQIKRPLRWSLRRELWENRSIYLAPLAASAFFFVGFLFSTIGMPHRRRATMLLDEAQRQATISKPYDAMATAILVTAMLVGVFYCLDALYGERRDRSILFWKSLPVSDRTAVASKALVPLAILPALTFALILVMHILMLLWSTLVLLPSGQAHTTWMYFRYQQWPILLYSLVVLTLWHAPIYAWLLMVSAWARRMPIFWGTLPLLAIAAFEKIAFNTQHFGEFLVYRIVGGIWKAMVFKPNGHIDSLSQLTPARFLTTPGLWTGLLMAALFLAAAVYMRRNREPI